MRKFFSVYTTQKMILRLGYMYINIYNNYQFTCKLMATRIIIIIIKMSSMEADGTDAFC